MANILILYHSHSGNIEQMSRQVARGIESVDGASAVLRTVAPVSTVCEATAAPVPDSGSPYATLSDLEQSDGLILGSPTHFGNMSASLKHFIDQTTSVWFSGALQGKPAAVFTSTGSLHGGQESTLLSMMTPLFHHGMLLVGLPYSDSKLMQTTRGGTPYGASHVSGADGTAPIDDNETALCRLLGQRVAGLALTLANTSH